MGTRYNAADVRDRLDRLRGAYDPLVEHEEVALPPGKFEEFATLAAGGYTGGGYAWVVREEPEPLSETIPDVDEPYPRVLLALGRGADGWGPPGGGREGAETYEEAAVREVREETGVDCEIRGCRRARYAVFRPGDVDEPASETADRERLRRDDGRSEIHTLWVYFTAADAGGSIDVLESELHGAAWFHDPPDAWHLAVEDHPWTWDVWEG